MSQRKKIMADIEALSRKLHAEKMRLLKHQRYLRTTINDNKLWIVAAMIPLCILTWKSGQAKLVRKFGKQLFKLGVVSAFSQFRKLL
ncbi:hypothetical protein [Legionella spiritensis]|uniref:hypothetical protein n=1 Tax=Legionella spiritensis TaxID=452 RepID=UPI000F7026E3|nr:hypothetical protein [Legionella spiritensis]VEG92070.1 Uncharacterised protein [Legionella spiritensis]